MLIQHKERQALTQHQREIAPQHMRDWFASDPSRHERYSLSVGEIFLDYSYNRITDQTIHLLLDLAEACYLKDAMEALFKGHPINITENRAVLHTALRDMSGAKVMVNGHAINDDIAQTQQQMKALAREIHSQTWLGFSGKPIKSIVNIGIGGSYIGPMMTIEALKEFAVSNLSFHFISSVDPAHLKEVLSQIDVQTTLFIVSSKSFTTLETLTNARTVLAWFKEKAPAQPIEQHFIAITAAVEKAIAFGIPEKNILKLWNWVGGRYSIWSAIGLPLMLMMGEKHFTEFLTGAYQMDQHFKQAPFQRNMPVLLALLGIWYSNFFATTVQAIIPYAHRLRFFIPYLQQVSMESQGKRVSLEGVDLPYATGSVLIGEEGVIGQHAYHQLLHQGQHIIPADFILVEKSSDYLTEHHHILLASALSQTKALMQGKTYEEAYEELLKQHPKEKAALLAKHLSIPGNKPTNILLLKQLTPQNLGALIALYEHKIFVQGVIWGINSFDQWGVELGKQLLPNILKHIKENKTSLG